MRCPAMGLAAVRIHRLEIYFAYEGHHVAVEGWLAIITKGCIGHNRSPYLANILITLDAICRNVTASGESGTACTSG